MKAEKVYILHIAECIRRIEENTSKGREEFMQSHTLQDAVLRNLQTMSEATQRLSSNQAQASTCRCDNYIHPFGGVKLKLSVLQY